MRRPYTPNHLRADIDQNFTPVPNELLADGISAASKLVWSYMFSKPNGWDFSAERIGKDLGLSTPTVKKLLNELIDSDWLIRYEYKRRSRYVFLVPNECTSGYDESAYDTPIKHTYGSVVSDSEEACNHIAPMTHENAVKRLELAYCVYDLSDQYISFLARSIDNADTWLEFDDIAQKLFTRDREMISDF